MVSLEERLDAAERMIKSESFRQNKGLGNEVGYYIFDYAADKELTVRERIEYMKRKNSKSNSNCGCSYRNLIYFKRNGIGYRLYLTK